MLIEIIADITCPWCFIGLKRLQSAVKKRPAYDTTFIWRPFLLNPDLHDGTVNRHQYLTRLFGNENRIRQFQHAVDTAGEDVGVPFNFHSANFTPSSVDAHRLIAFASTYTTPVRAAEALFTAYFVEGMNIAKLDVLQSLARLLGLPEKASQSFLHGDQGRQDVLDENAKVHRLGVNGVPAFVFEKRNIISGAQEPQALVNILDFIAAAERLEMGQADGGYPPDDYPVPLP